MRNNIETSCWKADLAAFGKRNHLRPTRLEVLGPDRNMESDFWLEDGLLLAGIDLDTDGERGPSVEIMLQPPTATSRNHMTHSVAGVKRIALNTTDSKDEGLEIEDREGAVTIMHFEVTGQD
jgi:hypothetical protein